MRSIDKKVVMAVTGLMLLGFVIMHLLGNLLIYRGPDALNGYAAKLRHMGSVLWMVRLTLLTAVIVHIAMAIILTRENRSARPIAYTVKRSAQTTYAARTMMVSGVLLSAFIVYHLLHFTFGVTHPGISHLTDALGRHDVYAMVVGSFHDPYLVLGYGVSMALLCAHLSHGIGSFLQSLGLNDERWLPVVTCAGWILSALLFVGYASIPTSILLGWVR